VQQQDAALLPWLAASSWQETTAAALRLAGHQPVDHKMSQQVAAQAAAVVCHKHADAHNADADVLTCADSAVPPAYAAHTYTLSQPHVHALQACRWSFLAFQGTFSVSLNVAEEPARRLLVFRLQESSFMRDFEGRWQVGRGCFLRKWPTARAAGICGV
jgi:hypothetical protein